MSSPYDNRSSSRRKGILTHWVPLAITVAIATAGVAAWAWSQRGDDEEEEEEEDLHGLDYDNADYGDNPPYGASRDDKPPDHEGPVGGTVESHTNTNIEVNAPTWGNRVSGALRRTPSPHQMLSSAGKTVTASVAAAGAVVGNALSSIREEDKTAYADHETWSEEADAKKERAASSKEKGSGKRRKVVAIVVSADTQVDELDDDGFEHASVLSHIPKHIDFSKIKLYILIYAPGLKDVALEPTGNLPPPSLSSSFSNIGHDQAQVGADGKSPVLTPSSANPAFNAVYSQALALVEKESNVLPFTSQNGHVHILRHLKPEIVYLQESLAGDNGTVITQLQTWLRYEIILVVGAESGHGGLADSESEAENKSKQEKWWQRPDRVGRGRGIVVVDGMRVHDDWGKRVQGNE